MNPYVNVLQQSGVFMALGPRARAQLRQTCKTLNGRVNLGIDKDKAQRVIRMAWYRMHLFRALCVSSTHSLAEHWDVFTDGLGPSCLLRGMGVFPLLALVAIDRDDPEKRSLKRISNVAREFAASLSPGSFHMDQHYVPMVEAISFRAYDDERYTRIEIQMRYHSDLFRFTHIVFLESSGEGSSPRSIELSIGTLSLGTHVWLDAHLPDEVTEIRINWRNFPIVSTNLCPVKIILKNVGKCFVLNSGGFIDHPFRPLIAQTPIVREKPILLEAFFPGDSVPRLLSTTHSKYEIKNEEVHRIDE